MKSTLAKVAVAFLLLPLALPCPDAAGQASGLDDDVVIRAMADEMTRTAERLEMDDVPRPYYVEYTVVEADMVSITATLGALEDSSTETFRYLFPDIRVGEYVFDNTNVMGGMFAMMGGMRLLPLEDDYDVLRHEIWLGTDVSYKAAAEVLARKQGLLKTMNIQDRPDDFSKEKPFVYVGDPHHLVLDRRAWEERTTGLSGVFRKYPEIQESQASFTAVGGTQRFLNNEGFRHRYGDYLYGVTMDGSAQAEDGMRISHGATLWVKRLEDLPSQEELAEKTADVAEKIRMMASAELGEEYAGPVLFQEGAAAGFFGDLFLQNVTDPREPLMGGSGDRLTKKVGKKVMADFLDVVDDPTRVEHDGKLLIGTMVVDDDGVQPQRIQLVEEGILKTVPMSRIPTRKVVGSNGHARGAMWSSPVGSPTNVFITSREGVTEEDLKQKMLELCREDDLEYGLLVKSLRAGSGYLGAPGIAFRVYVEDGREEPVRGLVFTGVELRALRDIVAAGTEVKAHNILFKDEMPVSVVCPSILVEELDLKKVPPQMEKRPYLPRPAFEEE